MNGRRTVGEVLEVLGSTFHSVDVRTAAVKEGDHWTSVLTIVRFSQESIKRVSERLSQLQQAHGSVKTQDFQIASGCFPFVEWEKFVKECGTGILRIGEDQFQLLQQVNISGQQGHFLRYNHELREENGPRWPGFEIFFGDYHPEKLNGETVTRQVAGLGWGSTYEAIGSLCGINIAAGTSKIYNFYLFFPFLATISNVRILTPTNTLELSIIRHKDLPPLTAIATIKEQKNAATQQMISRSQVQMKPIEFVAEQIERYEGSVELEFVRFDRLVEIKLVHPTLAEVGYLQDPMRDLIPVTERNVLWEAFRKFCPDAKIEEMLAEPHEYSGKKTKPSAAFELHVSWILGMFGFSTIVLGEYEKLFAKTTGVERGSVDILAARQSTNLLVLVACTLGPPSDADFANLVHMADVLRREVFAGTRVGIQSILFTGASTTLHGAYKEIDGGIRQIPIVNVGQLGILLDLIRDGQENVFFEFLANPTFYRLEKPMTRAEMRESA